MLDHLLLHMLLKQKVVTRSGTALKWVACENCSTEYVYLLKRTGKGRWFVVSGKKQQGVEEAERRLRSRLANGVDPVPCPLCGWYQQHMLPRARDLRYKWMRTTAFLLLPLSILLSLAASGMYILIRDLGHEVLFPVVLVAWILAGLAGAWIPILLTARAMLSASYDPNDLDVETRKHLGQQWAVTKEVYLERMGTI
ncbi:MAG: hypothetical protein JO112_14810 [Planctomycetes bacterium]|nr:hypothetical protein [Planctomycetota bacterium]